MKWVGGTEAHTRHKPRPHQRAFQSEGNPGTPRSPCEERVWARQLVPQLLRLLLEGQPLAQIAHGVWHSQVPQTMADKEAVVKGTRGHSPQPHPGVCKGSRKNSLSQFLPGWQLLHTFLPLPVRLASNQPASLRGLMGPPWSLKELGGTSLPSPQLTAAGEPSLQLLPGGRLYTHIVPPALRLPHDGLVPKSPSSGC